MFKNKSDLIRSLLGARARAGRYNFAAYARK